MYTQNRGTDMIRTQVYITEAEKNGLAAIAKQNGQKQSELIREAIDRLLEQTSESNQQAVLNAVAGMWKDRTDLPDVETIRSSWGRGD
jgi:metal-responsive CopG/Arc/MetJ family transcriptional regulator